MVELAHAADAKLVVTANEFRRTMRGRIKCDVLDRWTKTIVRYIEIDERAAHEDPGGMNLLVESVLAIDEKNAETLPGEQASALKSGQSGADDRYVVTCSHLLCVSVSLWLVLLSIIEPQRHRGHREEHFSGKADKGRDGPALRCFASV